MQLRNYKQRILIDPCYKIPLSVFRLRQAQFKVRSSKRMLLKMLNTALITNVNRTSTNVPTNEYAIELVLISM